MYVLLSLFKDVRVYTKITLNNTNFSHSWAEKLLQIKNKQYFDLTISNYIKSPIL